MNSGIKKLQMAQATVWIVSICLVALSEADLLPTCYAPASVQVQYMVQLYSVVSALAGSYMALRLFAFPRIKERIARAEEPEAMGVFRKYVWLRTALIAVVLWSNAALYYACSFHQTALYCFLISAAASVFCWPSEDAFRSLRTTNPQGK